MPMLLGTYFSLTGAPGAGGGGGDPGGGEPTYSTLFPDPNIGANSPGWAGYTWRQVIRPSELTGSGTHLRLTIGGIGGGATYTKVYVGVGATSGDEYDFENPPVQVTFDDGANTSKVVANGATEVSDDIEIAFNGATDTLVVAVYVDSGAGAADDFPSRNDDSIDAKYYYKSGVDEAADQNVSGYIASSGEVIGVELVEVGSVV